ncbi:MAG TPA: MarR family transcriptional regulator [Treponemataceae bacterium]|nr:MarR family transcriptional regulator [Treponemataceae bacterium]
MIDLCSIRKVQNAIRELEDRLVAETGLSLNDAMCLCALAKGISDPGSLAKALTLSPSRLSRILDALEGRGLISRRLSEEDRRGIEVRLTKKGGAVLEKYHCAEIDVPAELAFASK